MRDFGLFGYGVSESDPRELAASQAANAARLQKKQPTLLSSYQKLADQARVANLKREQEIRGLYGGIIGQNTKESPFYKAGMQDIETESQRLVGQETQGLISSGLYGTTTAASVPTKVATQFTQPSRMKLEDILQQRKGEAQLGLAGFVERINEPYPDYSTLMQAYTAMGSR